MKLAEQIFSEESGAVDAKFDHSVLEQRIKDAVTAAPVPLPGTLSPDTLEDRTIGTLEGGTRTFVVATRTRGTGAKAVSTAWIHVSLSAMKSHYPTANGVGHN